MNKKAKFIKSTGKEGESNRVSLLLFQGFFKLSEPIEGNRYIMISEASVFDDPLCRNLGAETLTYPANSGLKVEEGIIGAMHTYDYANFERILRESGYTRIEGLEEAKKKRVNWN